MAWSPEQIAGRLRVDGVVSVSPERIYQHVRLDRKQGGDLWRSLRRRGKKPNVTAGRDSGRGCIPNRVDIAARPACVAAKSRVGDWEADTVIGKGHRGALVTLVDRMSKLVLIQKVNRKTAAAVGAAINTLLAPYPVQTITADNGKEFAGHEALARTLAAQFFFARPYASWERGLNEHTNGLIRGYFPKGTDFLAVTATEVQRVQDALNARPLRPFFAPPVSFEFHPTCACSTANSLDSAPSPGTTRRLPELFQLHIKTIQTVSAYPELNQFLELADTINNKAEPVELSAIPTKDI
ncbi:MAG: IS30 family transposase [Aestuariivita sp.]|nr:IS30 family transposase [Aestuariivita sp.]